MWKELNTTGERGTEDGIIIKYEEYKDSIRITLETCPRYGKNVFAITCGIYGSMVHTCFYDEKEVCTIYELMKLDLQEFFDREEIMSDEEESFYDYFTSKYK